MTFVKGESGNTGGHGRTFRKEFRRLAKDLGLLEEAITVLKDGLKGKHKVECAKYTLDQLIGKPTQAVDIDHKIDGVIDFAYNG